MSDPLKLKRGRPPTGIVPAKHNPNGIVRKKDKELVPFEIEFEGEVHSFTLKYKEIVDLKLYSYLTNAEIAKKVRLSHATIIKVISIPAISYYIQKQKDEIMAEQKEKLKVAISEATNALISMLKPTEKSDVRFKAATLILKNFEIIDDNLNIKHSGQIELPVINITSTTEQNEKE